MTEPHLVFTILGRLVKLVALVKNEPIRVADIAISLKVNPRTVQRDIDMLLTMDCPLMFNSVDYCYSLRKSWSFWAVLRSKLPEDVTVKTKAIRSRRCRICKAKFRSVRKRWICDNCHQK